MFVLGAIQNMKKTGALLDIWSETGVDGVAFTVPYDQMDNRFFDNTRVARDRGMRVIIHPVAIGGEIYSSSDPSLHAYMLEKLALSMDMIKAYDLEPMLVIHPPRLAAPNDLICGKKELDEKTAFANSVPFFDKLERLARQASVSIALECMHDPYANPGHHLLGYTVQQLQDICDDRDFGICVDTGHAKLSRTSVSEYLNSPLNILAVHLHGNDGTYDQHVPPTMKNVGDADGVLRLLGLDIPIVFEVNSYDVLESAEQSKQKTISNLSTAVSTIREKRLPPG